MVREQTAGTSGECLLAWLSLLVAAVGAAIFPIRSFDTFWHLVSGRWILQHRILPQIDPFRFTSVDESWVDHEWLFQVVAALIERLAGLDGLIVFRALLVAAMASVLLVALRRIGVSPFFAFLLALSTITLARLRFLIRPELTSLLALSILLACLEEYRRRGGWRWIFGMTLLVIVWANSHLGVLIAPPLSALFLLGTRLPGGTGDPRRGDRPAPWAAILGLPVILAAAICANPYRHELFEIPTRIAAALGDLAGVNPEWLPLLAAPRPWVLVAMVVVTGLWVVEWRCVGRIDPSTMLVTLALGALTLVSVRHRGLFYLGAVFALAESIAAIRSTRTAAMQPVARRVWWPATIAFVAVLGFVFAPGRGPLGVHDRIGFGFGLAPGRYPAAAVDAVSDWPDLGNLFNDAATGGYLLWRWYPQRQVFIDGRNEVGPDLLRELVAAVRSRDSWQALLDRYAIDGGILDNLALPSVNLEGRTSPDGSPRRGTAAARSSLYFPSEQFALVYWDDTAMLFVRRSERRREKIAAMEYSAVRPDEPDLLIARAKHDPQWRELATEELQRRLATSPRSARAQALLTALASLDF
ncbi:MAG: hypothetical protein P8Y44_01435 [Acidobacteriota bacterium]